MSHVSGLVEVIATATDHEAEAIHRLLRRASASGLPLSADALVEALVEAIDRDLQAQLDVIFAHPALRRLEETWLGLRALVFGLPRDRELKVEVLNCSLEDLLADFEDAPEIPKSGLYKLIYSAEYGPFGGRPYAAVVCHHAVEAKDLRLLEQCAGATSFASLPFIARAGDALVARPPPEWEQLRAQPSARFVALVAGRWLARTPHRADPWAGRPWRFRESDGALRWASGTFLLAQRLATSFVTHRTPIHAFGPEQGRVEGLPSYAGRSTEEATRLDGAAARRANGFIPLVEIAPGVVELAGETTCLGPAAPYPEGLRDEERAVHASLTSLLFAGRFVHYLKVLQREQIGTWRTAVETERAMSAWLRTYLADEHREPDLAGRDDTERELIARLHESPEDVGALQGYATWLEASGHALQARYVLDEIALREAHELAGSRTGHAPLPEEIVSPALERLVSRGRYARILRDFRLSVREPHPDSGWWSFELQLEPERWLGGRSCRLSIAGKLDGE
jgi:type VI secretion system protein ImpC